jgi:hypothetical protein
MTIALRTKVRTARYHAEMGVRKVSVSLDEDVFHAAERAAAAAGMSLSAWLSQAARRAARIEEGLRGVAEYEAEHGAFTEEELRWADDVLDRLGVGREVR